tara:strand:+ start:3969 stop:5462 length:1494 start_codon:yes stop_codon:yes gene_type:complete
VKKNKIYIGGGFTEDQLLWIVPIVSYYSKKNSNNLFIFENELSKTFLNNRVIRTHLKNVEHIVQKDLYFFSSKLIKYFLILFKYLPQIFFYVLFVNRKSILKDKKDWFTLQLKHSFWDTSLNMAKDGEIEPTLINKFISIIRCYAALELANKIHKTGVCTVFLGHTVYASRTLLAYLREKQIKIFTQASFNLHYQPKSEDNSWLKISKKKLETVRKKVNFQIISNYFNKRTMGKGNYLDSQIAMKQKKNIQKLNNFNVLFLHVFKDSPFNVIDKNRIFTDYYEWVIETLKIIKNSDQLWVIRLHPSSKRWGENQLKTLETIFKIIFKNKLPPKNIIIDEGAYSNNFLIKESNKILTFNGSVQLESACYGKRSITISSNLSEIDKNLNLCPRNISEYRKLLLMDQNIFMGIAKISNVKIRISKYILFIRENLHYLKKDLNSLEIYRNDGNKLRTKTYNDISKKLDFNKKLFKRNGENLRNGATHTISSKYMEYFDILK